MIIHNFDPVFIDLGFFQIRWYALAYIAGIVIGLIYGKKIAIYIKKKVFKYNVNPNLVEDLIPYLIIGIILGGRLGYVLFYNFNYYINNLTDIIKIWQGGMSFHGGLIGIVIASIWFGKKNNQNSFLYTDIISLVAPIGIFFGRIANFLNSELIGRETDIFWSVKFVLIDNISRHPSQIYEAILEGLVLFFILLFACKKYLVLRSPGNASAIFLIFYGVFRIISEIFRLPDEQIGYIFGQVSIGMIISLPMVILGIILFNR